MTTNPTADDVLAPCPHCDGKAIFSTFPALQVRCGECVCGTGMYANDAVGRKNAIAAWNLRTNPPPVAAASDDFTLAAEEVMRFIGFENPAVLTVITNAIRRGAETGAAREREAVVRWLRTTPNWPGSPIKGGIANCIEIGDHLTD